MIDLIPGIGSTTSALTAERIRLDMISQNIANANTTRTSSGQPYQRQQVAFETVLSQQDQFGNGGGSQSRMVKVARIQPDTRPPRVIYSPGHPDANAQGMVAMPDINIHEEMADLIASSRSYEANLAVVHMGRSLALQTMAIGKRG
jgi:flagellar basal-body rod protein FlgC